MPLRSLFVVSPAYNEAESLPRFLTALADVAGHSFAAAGLHVELVLVDDGSTDASASTALQSARALQAHLTVSLIQLSRNFGQQAAIQAGLEYAYSRSSAGDCFAIMDSDLQHPPSLLPEMMHALDNGADHVQMLREDPPSLPWVKRATSRAFYSLFRLLARQDLQAGSADFRGLSRPCLEGYLRLSESCRFNRGLFQWIGFQRHTIAYTAPARTHGETKYGIAGMMRFALSGLIQFSSAPLVAISTLIVLASFSVCLVYVVSQVINYLRGGGFVWGWASIMFFIAFWSGALAFNQLLQALYIARIFDEVKRRPVYLIRRIEVEGAGSKEGLG